MKQFILVLLINYCIIISMNNCKPTFATPCDANQTILLYTLKLYRDVCQIFINKTRKISLQELVFKILMESIVKILSALVQDSGEKTFPKSCILTTSWVASFHVLSGGGLPSWTTTTARRRRLVFRGAGKASQQLCSCLFNANP